jgi:hypothetical protein
LDVFETMLAQSSFELDRPLTGMEIAGDLVDADYQPAMSNQHVLAGVQRRADARARARDDRLLADEIHCAASFFTWLKMSGYRRMCAPPLRSSTSPVSHGALHRNTTASAMSSGVPARPSGVFSTYSSTTPGIG